MFACCCSCCCLRDFAAPMCMISICKCSSLLLPLSTHQPEHAGSSDCYKTRRTDWASSPLWSMPGEEHPPTRSGFPRRVIGVRAVAHLRRPPPTAAAFFWFARRAASETRADAAQRRRRSARSNTNGPSYLHSCTTVDQDTVSYSLFSTLSRYIACTRGLWFGRGQQQQQDDVAVAAAALLRARPGGCEAPRGGPRAPRIGAYIA